MPNKTIELKKIFFILSFIFSILGFTAYVWLSVIVEKAYSSNEFDEQKYFAHLPSWLAGFYRMGAFIWIVLIMAILMLILSGNLLNKKFQIISIVVLVLDLAIFPMSLLLLL